MERYAYKLEIDEILRSKRKTIALVVTSDARLVIRAPYRASLKYIEELVEKKRKWIIDKQQAARLRAEAHKVKEAVDGEEFLFLGVPYRLHVLTGRRNVELKPEGLFLYCTAEEDRKKSLEAWYKKQSRRVFLERVGFYEKQTGLHPKSVSLSGARKRWGSCGPKNTLNLAWRLVMAPPDIIDYVVVHELAHIQFKNHSRDFWNRVAGIMPDYKECRKWLVKNQKLLELL